MRSLRVLVAKSKGPKRTAIIEINHLLFVSSRLRGKKARIATRTEDTMLNYRHNLRFCNKKLICSTAASLYCCLPFSPKNHQARKILSLRFTENRKDLKHRTLAYGLWRMFIRTRMQYRNAGRLQEQWFVRHRWLQQAECIRLAGQHAVAGR